MVTHQIAVVSGYLIAQDDLQVKSMSKTHPESPSLLLAQGTWED